MVSGIENFTNKIYNIVNGASIKMNRNRKLKLLFELTKLGSIAITGPRAVRLGSYFILNIFYAFKTNFI